MKRAVKCDDMNVVLMVDDAINPNVSRMESGRRRAIGKLLARDVINRLRRASEWNEVEVARMTRTLSSRR